MEYHITGDKKAQELQFTQHFYVQSVTERFGVEKTNRISTMTGAPAPTKVGESQNLEKKMEQVPY